MIRFEMAYGKAYAALAMGRSSRLVKARAPEKPIFMRYLISALAARRCFRRAAPARGATPTAKSSARSAVTGDTEDRDEELAAHGIRAVGLRTDEDCAGSGRRGGVRLTNK